MITEFKRGAWIASLLCIIMGFLGFTGWIFDVALLKSVLPELKAMNPLTAILFSLAGISLLLLLKGEEKKSKVCLFISHYLPIFIFTTGLLIFTDLLLNLDLKIDLLCFADKVGSSRMTRNTALNFLIIGLSLFLARREYHKPFRIYEILTFGSLILTLLALLGYLFSIKEIYNIAQLQPMALNTAFTFFILAIGILIAFPEKGFMEPLVQPGSSSAMARKQLFMALIIPTFMGYIHIKGEEAGWYDHNFTVCLTVVSTIFIFIPLLWWIAKSLTKSDKEKQLIEEEVKRSRDYYLSILDEMPTLVWLANLNARQDYFNKSWLEFTGRAMEAQLNNGWLESLHPEDRMVFLQTYLKGIQEETTFEAEYRLKRYDGVYRWMNALGRPLYDANKKLIGFLGSCHDITEKKLHKQKMEEARELAENANLLKSRFLANMSHEIRTPLNAIIGFAEILDKQELSKDNQKEYINYITSSGNMLLKLIGDILDVSKIEEGKLEIIKESFFFKEVISSSILPYKYKANEKGLEFSLEFDEYIPHYVIGDSYRIKQILINLIGNAMKFTQEGSIVVRISNLNKEKYADSVVLRFEVIDTGIGIPEDKQHTIFENFTQADNSIVRKFGGSGLGLSIVKQLIALMGGNIGIQSPSGLISDKGGPGSCFYFSIPLPVDKSVIKPPLFKSGTLEDLQVKKGIKVLVVEDNVVNQRLAKVVLKKIGCEAEFASNGKEALDKIEAGSTYSLIFMDVQMPVMDGYEATRHLREKYKVTLPVIGLTANVFKEDIDNCLMSGMNDYLGKPYSDVQISSMIRKWT